MVWVLQWLELDILLLLIVNKLIGESYLAGQFRQIKRSLAEQFRQIKRILAEQWRFNRKKHVKGGGLLGLVWYRDPPFILFLTSPPCTVSAATTSDSEVNL